MIGKNKKAILLFFLSVLIILMPFDLMSFGFYAHRKINRMAVFTIHPDLMPFYRKHIEYLTERSIDPDRRAHVVPGEAARHYIDIDHFGENPFENVPRQWDDAVKKFTEDTLQKYGIIPWHINVMMNRLTYAFKDKDVDRILYNSAHLGHYIGDACTPLHTTLYYDGRNAKQRGIHALWESRLPELFADDYDYFVGRAEYIESPLDRAWELIINSHEKIDTIFMVYDHIYDTTPADKIYAHEMRGQSYVRPYSKTFSEAFHDELNGMVERQMQLAVKSVGDFWYTAWINAGQPDVNKLLGEKISNAHQKKINKLEKEWESADESHNRKYSR